MSNMNAVPHHVRGFDDWFIEVGHAGDAYFAAPFAAGIAQSAQELQGELPQIQLSPDEVPSMMWSLGDPDLEDGLNSGHALAHTYPNVEIDVLVTDTEQAATLRSERLRQQVGRHTLIAACTVRGVRAPYIAGTSADGLGRLTTPDGRPYQAEYTDEYARLVASEPYNRLEVDPERDPRTGLLQRPADRLIESMRDTTRALAEAYGVDEMRTEAADLATRNMDQWRIASAFLAQVFQGCRMRDGKVDRAVLIVSSDMPDIARRLPILGVDPNAVNIAALTSGLDMGRLSYESEVFAVGGIPELFKR